MKGKQPVPFARVAENLLRDAKLTQICEGTNRINRFEIMEAVSAERP